MALSANLDQLRVHVLSVLSSFVLWALSRTWKIRSSFALDNGIWANLDSKIVIFWHNRQLMMPFVHERLCPPGMPVATLISRHADGRIIAQAVKRLGLDSVAGSSTRGATSALRALGRKLKTGQTVAITPDGPKGPRYSLKPGPIHLALLTKATIHPVCCSASRAWVFGSWDKMILPKPFATLYFAEAPGISVGEALKAEGMTEDLLRERLEQILQKLTAEADAAA